MHERAKVSDARALSKIQRCVPAWTGMALFFDRKCTAAHVHRTSRRSVYYNFVQDAAVDLEALLTRKDHAFIVTIHCRHSFLCSGYIGAAVHRRRLDFTCAIVSTLFFVVKCALYLAFSSSLHSLAAWFRRFFSTRDFKWPALSEVNRATFYQ